MSVIPVNDDLKVTCVNTLKAQPFNPMKLPQYFSHPGLVLLAGFLTLVPLQQATAQVEMDNFDDSNDTEWLRYDPLAPFELSAAYSFPNGGYRLRTPYITGQAANPGRAGTTRSQVYTDFYVSVDIVDWNDSLPQSAGLLARINTPGLQSTTGYAFTWDRGNTNSSTSGDVDISRITGEAPTGITVAGSDAIHFEPGEKYRMVFIGKGTVLEGRVYKLPDTSTPLVTITGSDPAVDPYLSGVNGMVIYDNSGGRQPTDVTFDNFFASDVEPPRLVMGPPDFGGYELSWPQEASAFVLQTATALTGSESDWTDVEIGAILPPSLDIPRYRYTMAASTEVGGGPQQFFRLVRRATLN